ncbi:MAG: cysteine hydrolase [Pseudonocardia sp.]|nr:cysteine hydrolase [Pseudonocardia sp.]
MPDLTTLRAVSGLPADPPALSASTLVLIDCQNTYTRGLMELEGVQAALDQAEELLDRARGVSIPIIHIQHDAGPGSPYDIREEIGAIVDRVAPRSGEATVVKNYPNSFTGTELDSLLKQYPARPLLLAGFMTHMCVNSTARGAFSLGYAPTVVGGATATRALPGTAGGAKVPAATLQAASLASIADLFGVVVADQRAIPD